MADTAILARQPARAMTSVRTELLEAAVRIGRGLCDTAYWSGGRCNWVGRSQREVSQLGSRLRPTVTALGPELYAGTAGIGFFLAQLSTRVDLVEVRETAHGAIRQAIHGSDGLPSEFGRSFYSGLIGIAYAAAHVGILLDNHDLIEEALRVAYRATVPQADTLLDVISGNAGALVPLLWLANLPGAERLVDAAMLFAEELATAANRHKDAWCWDNDRACGRGVGHTPLCGMAHGAAGMGLALIEAGVAGGRDHWVAGGLAAFRYEDELYDNRHQNWPDLREHGHGYDRTHASDSPKFMVAWCHGAGGIGLARLRAVQLLAERRAGLLVGAQRALDATMQHLRLLPVDSDASPCHGRAGLAETLLFGTEVLGDPKYANYARRMWRRLMPTYKYEPWPCGVPSGRYNPSFMLGHAGIGYAFLRASDPGSTPSLLLPKAQAAVHSSDIGRLELSS
jgi:lantibiotic modifying enzyme